VRQEIREAVAIHVLEVRPLTGCTRKCNKIMYRPSKSCPLGVRVRVEASISTIQIFQARSAPRWRARYTNGWDRGSYSSEAPAAAGAMGPHAPIGMKLAQ
jgi:hypothetical protein